MSTLNDIQKLKYINERFHQYFDFGINTNITTTEEVNLCINIQDLFDLGDSLSTTSNYHHDIQITNDFDIDECLKQYADTTIEKELRGVCTRVIDGDTIEVKIINEDASTYIERIRLVGINTPEQAQNGFESSKLFVEKCCYSKQYLKYLNNPDEYDEAIVNNKHIYLNIDNKKERDSYGRLLAVVIVDNKNINEILLKEKIAEVMYIPPSEFNPNDWRGEGTSVSLYNYKNDDIALLSPYLNAEMTNIVFTPTNNTNTLYRFEIYKGIIYLKLKPYSQYIRMHILPKAYDCSDTVLILTDNDVDKRTVTYNTSKYKIYEERNNINAYFQENNEDRNRENIVNKSYNKNDWDENPADISTTFVDFTYDISNSAESFTNLQICTGYRYNKTSPYYALHYTGVKDNEGMVEDRCTLIDANIDNVKGNSTNIITQMMYNDDNVYIKHDPEIRKEIGINDHTSEVGILHHKIIKYINDALYIEEEKIYGTQEWIDRKQEEVNS